MNYDAIIFDLDGTLWDSTETVAESWSATLRREGEGHIFSAADIAGIMGCTDREIENRLFLRFGGRAHELCVKCMGEEPAYVAVHGGRIYEGVEAMMDTLCRPYPLFIVSNCQSGYVEAFLTYSGFGRYFKDYEYLGRKGLSKAENIRLIMSRHGIAKAVYVGDTAHDRMSAESAGCAFVHAAYGFGKCEKPFAVINKPLELCSLMTGENYE